MNYCKTICTDVKERPIKTSGTGKKELLSYYEKAGPDYATWSKKFNMHFGYFSKGMNPFNREAMLENMNLQVFKRLKLDRVSNGTLVDLGCGLGATLRTAGANFPHLQLIGLTLVPWQVQQARELNNVQECNKEIQIIEADYCAIPLEDASVDSVLAIESSCYAPGASKYRLFKEIYRVLKPGGHFVIADGFLKSNASMGLFIRRAYNKLCQSWALTELGNIKNVEKSILALNFKDYHIEERSWNVAPSVAHVPFTVLTFLTRQLIFGGAPMCKERWDNLKSPLLTLILGLTRKHFGYYLISGTK
ncbi:class I SAM-dependent methyltransferase [Fulvivirga sp. M361]|uniref:class I SAM-dependent methyltransferase n=1 Tax=Fulvivirga sp. M361 TaxID=2594266 RepID=UPI00117BB8DB|nr:class I SAM-dependent methyltransferase [Fulvivirga sp. M361]TRX61312.1 class I SAM-dependent methyltransferase [Fulvivirga sp. M361]